MKHTGTDGIGLADNTLAILKYGHALVRIFASSIEVNGRGKRQLFISGTKDSIDIKPIENNIVVAEAFFKDCPDCYKEPCTCTGYSPCLPLRCDYKGNFLYNRKKGKFLYIPARIPYPKSIK